MKDFPFFTTEYGVASLVLKEIPYKEESYIILRDAQPGQSFQFMRLGYFTPDSKDSSPDHLVFNRSVGLKDSFKPAK